MGSYDSQGEFILGKRMKIKDADSEPASIFSIATTEDGRVLVGGSCGTLYMGTYGLNLETLKRHLPEIIAKEKPY